MIGNARFQMGKYFLLSTLPIFVPTPTKEST